MSIDMRSMIQGFARELDAQDNKPLPPDVAR